MSEMLRVPAGEGRAVLLGAGQSFRVVDVAGGQVGDLFAFTAADPGEFASASHTRVAIGKLFPRNGDPVLTNRRRPILSVLEDTSPGWHDMLYAACDPARYASLGAPGPHRSCAGNLAEALAGRGVEASTVPQPINVFMDVRARPDQHRDRLCHLSAAACRPRTLFSRQTQLQRIGQVRDGRARIRRGCGDQHRRLRHGHEMAKLGAQASFGRSFASAGATRCHIAVRGRDWLDPK